MGENTIMRSQTCCYRGTFRVVHSGNIKYVRGSIAWNSETGQGWISVADSSAHKITLLVECPAHVKELGTILEWCEGYSRTYRAPRRYISVRSNCDPHRFRSIKRHNKQS